MQGTMAGTSSSVLKQASGGTALHAAAGQDRVDIVKLLLDGGSELEATDKYLSTPLFVAVQQGQTPVVEYLVSVGADPNTQNYVRVACAPGCHWSHVPALTACVPHHSRA